MYVCVHVCVFVCALVQFCMPLLYMREGVESHNIYNAAFSKCYSKLSAVLGVYVFALLPPRSEAVLISSASVSVSVCLFVGALTFEWFHFSSPNFQRIFI